MLRKTSAAAAVIAITTAGSALFGGTALAQVINAGGPGGNGGNATNNCVNVGVPIQALNIASTANQDLDQCFATGGAGGAGGAANLDG
jgi:hypothetical protein